VTLLADLLSTIFERRYDRLRWRAPQDDRPLEALTEALLGTAGEASGQALAQAILDRFAAADDAGKLAFFRHLAVDLNIQPDKVRRALDAYEVGQSKHSYRAFMTAAEPPRQELIRRLNQIIGATKALVAMRADLLRLADRDSALDALDLDFRHLLASWFNRGFLVLRPINWASPAHILEKIIAYEAVHAIDSWDELRRRLEPEDRRCFAFFHPAMPDEPLIFVEVALTQGTPSSIQDLLQEDRLTRAPEEADTATFYSISNCQAGLAKISFGNSLIKQVAADLAHALPSLKTFVTLSPIPGFVPWLEEQQMSETDDPEKLKSRAALYLTRAKGRDGLPRDPVARFHLGNGAELYRLHAEADLSEKGHRQSRGVMVNYLYDLERVSTNHEQFTVSRDVVMSNEVRSMVTAADNSSV